MKRFLHLLLMILIGLIAKSPNSSHAAVYWYDVGVLSNPITVCFVDNAVTTRPDRVEQVLSAINQFEQSANIRFIYWGTCPSPFIRNGQLYHDGDIRIKLKAEKNPNTEDVPPDECPTNGQSEQDWSDGPNALEENRPCLYNMRLTDNPWNGTPYINTTLHEFGHALGLDHEHIRPDADAGCTEAHYGPNLPEDDENRNRARDNSMTRYDRNSVMSYRFDSCGISGNDAHTGLSDLDKLALHILYPETDKVAEFIGATVIRTTDTLNLQSAWKTRGANVDYVIKEFTWKVDGRVLSRTSDLITSITAPGDYSLEFSYIDFLDRHYLYIGTVRVLTPEAYNQLMASVVSIQQSLLLDAMVPDEVRNTVFLPIAKR